MAHTVRLGLNLLIYLLGTLQHKGTQEEETLYLGRKLPVHGKLISFIQSTPLKRLTGTSVADNSLYRQHCSFSSRNLAQPTDGKQGPS